MSDDKNVTLKVELPEAVNGIIKKPSETLGDKLSDLIEIIFGGITYKKEKIMLKREQNLNKFKEELVANISAIPEGNRIDPSENIVGSALEAVKYKIDIKSIREMFAQLIASAMNTDTSDNVLPIFIEILKGLSARDAAALKDLCVLRLSHFIPVMSIGDNMFCLPNMRSHYCPFLSQKFGIEQSNIILDTLLRYGLIEIRYVFQKDSVFQGFTFEKIEREFDELRHDVPRDVGRPVEYKYGTIVLTSLGYEFSKVCAPESYSDLEQSVKNHIKG